VTPKQAAYKLLRGYKLTRPTLDDLHAIISETGYDLIDYDPHNQTQAFKILADELELTPEILQQNAFTFSTGISHLLFIQEQLSTEEKRLALAHELGHIVCNHLQDPHRPSSVKDEYEANEFAHYLLHPSLAMRVISTLCRHSKLVIIAILIILTVIISSIVRQNQITRTKLYGEYYTTPSGKKYHKPGCSYIKDRTNLHRVTVEEIESGLYEPCKYCNIE